MDGSLRQKQLDQLLGEWAILARLTQRGILDCFRPLPLPNSYQQIR